MDLLKIEELAVIRGGEGNKTILPETPDQFNFLVEIEATAVLG